MLMQTAAYDVGTRVLFRVHMDTTKIIPDPSLPAPEEGEPDTRPQVPDPDWVLELTWGKEPPEGQTMEAYLTNCKTEAERLAALDPRIQPEPQEIVLPI